MIMSECYLDNSATTKPCKKAVENMLYALETCWGNPSSLHDKGIEADELLLKARKAVASALSANEKEIYFTSGGTEGNNLAIFGAAYKNRRKGNRVITTAVEHPSVQKAFDRLQSEGFEVVRLKTDSFGRVSKEELYEAIDEKTEAYRWFKVVENTLIKYRDDYRHKLIVYLYFNRLTPNRASRRLNIDRATLFRWKNEILLTAEFWAFELRAFEK